MQQHRVVGSIELLKKEDENDAIRDVEESFDVSINSSSSSSKPKSKPKSTPKPKPKSTPKSKPTASIRFSRRLKAKEKEKVKEEKKKDYKPRTTRNSRKSNKDIAASSIVDNAKNRKGKWNYKVSALVKREKDKKEVKCTVCPKKFATYMKLVNHLKTDHPDYKFPCKYCPKTFDSSSWRYQHQMRHEGLRYKCPVCFKLFQYYYMVRDHYKVHSKKKLYVCPSRNCLKGFTTKRARKYHQASHDIPEGVKEFTCDFVPDGSENPCAKTFARKELLDQHKRAHSKSYVTHCGIVKNSPVTG